MPWVVGIDEAGYGPNLGPLVQAAVPLRLPAGDPSGWEVLKSHVRRAHEKDDGRLLIDDSKKVYPRDGLGALERGVRAALILLDPTVGDLFRKTALPGVREELAAESWHDPAELAPVAATHETVLAAFTALSVGLGAAGAGFGPAVASVVPAPRFNRICDKFGSKGAVLARGLVELIPAALDAMKQDREPVVILCDKQGGRNYYAALVQQAFPDGWVVAERESAAESRYRVEQLDRTVTVAFRPRADGDSVAVALASMLCKYLREVCMRQFNRFWATHVPGIMPTAGYPGDARRFYAEIRPAMTKLGFSEDQVWRKR
ncbi:MAG: ribonuclease [Gemmataceae bacterium]|nr:ribonuclease [Gemmataceae bacterium]